MAKRKPIPKTQKELSAGLVKDPSIGSSPNDTSIDYTKRDFNRALKTKVTHKDAKPFTVGIQDIDESIQFYFQNIIKPTVSKNGQNLEVPIYYGSPERWSAIQKDGFLRGRDGQLQIPAVVFKRTNMTRERITNKLDANGVNNFYVFKPKFTKENAYDNFSAQNGLDNRIPTQKAVLSVVPDFVTINYSCVIFTDFVEHMNKITEAINYASDSYWGDPARFKFKSSIDSFSPTVELQTGDQRAVKTTFDISLKGYLIPDVAIKDLSYDRIIYSPSKIIFTMETVSGAEAFTDDALQQQVIVEQLDSSLEGGGDLG
tara:strand:+ start:564 stop:1508 length:945 start_codon:yes stop_codon:yes gene_type:complete